VLPSAVHALSNIPAICRSLKKAGGYFSVGSIYAAGDYVVFAGHSHGGPQRGQQQGYAV
jgi:hypothetical protein